MSFDFGLTAYYHMMGSGNSNSIELEISDQHKLEKEFCTDFSCCGLHFNDLHELLEHDEAYHASRSNDNKLSIDPTWRIPIPAVATTLHIRNGVFTPSPGINHVATDPKLSTCFLAPASPELSTQFVPTTTTAPDSPLSTQSTVKTAEEVEDEEKPYRCPVEDCDKAYKNSNGLKYHQLHGHCPPDEIESKPFICTIANDCNKRYKNLNGLKYHIEHTHGMKVNLTSDMFLNKDFVK